MSLRKSIESGAEHRTRIRKHRQGAIQCEERCKCEYCVNGRTHAGTRQRSKGENQVDEWFGYWGMVDGADVISELQQDREDSTL